MFRLHIAHLESTVCGDEFSFFTHAVNVAMIKLFCQAFQKEKKESRFLSSVLSRTTIWGERRHPARDVTKTCHQVVYLCTLACPVVIVPKRP